MNIGFYKEKYTKKSIRSVQSGFNKVASGIFNQSISWGLEFKSI